MAATATHATYFQTAARQTPPAMAVQDRLSFVKEIFGEPVFNTDYATQGGLNEQNIFVESLVQLMMGENRTNLGSQIVHQQLVADNFWVTVLAPIVPLNWGESLEGQWDMITFHPHLPQVLPEEGRTRIGSWEYTSATDTVNRAGLGAEFHHEFLFTPKGMMLARGTMAQINLGISEYLKLGVLRCIQTANDVYLERQRKKFVDEAQSRYPQDWFERYLKFFGRFQFDENAQVNIPTLVDEDMREYGGKSNTVLMPWKIPHFQKHVNPRFTEFSRIGDSARATLESSIDSYGSLGNNKVYIVRAFDTDRNRGPIDLLKNDILMGEAFLMFDHVPKYIQSYKGYSSDWRSIEIMNGDGKNDGRDTVTLEQALLATGMFDPSNGKLIGPDHDYLQKFKVEAGGKNGRHSFWYYDKQGKAQPARFFGQILKVYFSAESIANLARTVINRAPKTLEDYESNAISKAFGTLFYACRYMRNVTADANLKQWYRMIIAQNAARFVAKAKPAGRGAPSLAGAVDVDPNAFGGLDLPELTNAGVAAVLNRASFKGRYLLPPGYQRPSGLLTLAEAVRKISNPQTFEDTYGFDYKSCKAVADALVILENFVPTLSGVFKGSAMLDPNYVTSSNHYPTAFVAFLEGTVCRGDPSLWLRRPQVTARVAQQGSAYPSVDIQRAIVSNISLLAKAQKSIEDRFLGKLATIKDLVQRYGIRTGTQGTAAQPAVGTQAAVAATGTGVQIPLVVTISANVSSVAATATNAAALDKHVAFDPAQGDTFANLRAALPDFAQARFAGTNNYVSTSLQDGTIGRATAAVTAAAAAAALAAPAVFIYSEDLNADAAVTDAVKNAYAHLARIRLNFVPKDDEVTDVANSVDQLLSAYKISAVITALYSMINNEGDAAAIAARIEKVKGLVGANGVPPANDAAGHATINKVKITDITRAIDQLFKNDKAGAEDLFGKSGTGNQRTAQSVIKTLTDVQTSFDADLPALRIIVEKYRTDRNVPGAAAGISRGVFRFTQVDYLRTDLGISGESFASGYEFAEKDGEPPVGVPSDPLDNDTIISAAKWNEYTLAYRTPNNEQGFRLPANIAPEDVFRYKTLDIDATPVVTAAKQLYRKQREASGLFGTGASNSTGVMEDVETRARASENYTARRQEDLIPYDDGDGAAPPRPGAASGSRFSRAYAGMASMEVDGANTAPAYFRPRTAGAGNVVGITAKLVNPNNVDQINTELASAFTTDGFVELWHEMQALEETDPALAAIGKVYMTTPTDKDNWLLLIRKHCVVPITILLARPFIRLSTYPLYFIYAGSETMITRFGQPITTWANESQRQVWTLTLAFKSKTWCINPRNIYRLPDVFICGLGRGFGIGFFKRDDLRKAATDSSANNASLIAIPEPYEPWLRRKLPPLLSLTGKFKFMQDSFQDDPEFNDMAHYYNVFWANAFWGFQKLTKDERVSEVERMRLGANAEHKLNFICWASQSCHYHPGLKGYKYMHASRGPIPNNRYGPGMCKAMRDGTDNFPTYNYETSGFVMM